MPTENECDCYCHESNEMDEDSYCEDCWKNHLSKQDTESMTIDD